MCSGSSWKACCSTAAPSGGISSGAVQPEYPPPGVVVRQRRPQTVQCVAPSMEQGTDRGPLFLTEEELRTSAAVFPLEFLEIQEQHRVLGGRDPFIGFHVKTDRLRETVVQGFTSHLLRLRQRYVEGGGSDDATTILLPLSITSTLPLLRGMQRLLGRPALSHSDAVITDVAEQLKLDLQGLLDALVAQARTDFSWPPRSASSL